MPKLPRVSIQKDLPEDNLISNEIPNESDKKNDFPQESPKLNMNPDESAFKDTVLYATAPKEEKPSDVNEDNCVIINNTKIELKPTKLKYFRNKAASGYGVIKGLPIYELLTYGKGVLDENRDADQLLYDFLVAAFDDPVFIRDCYDDLDAEIIERIIKIFGRINHIDEKEEAIRKNREAQEQAKR